MQKRYAKGRPRRRYNSRRSPYPSQSNKIKKLDMSKSDEFQYVLSNTVVSLPDDVRGAIKGGIYALFSKRGVGYAKDFIQKKNNEGIIPDRMSEELMGLIHRYSKYQ